MFPGFFKGTKFTIDLTEITRQLRVVWWREFHILKRIGVQTLAVPDPVKTEIKIAYPERNIVECTLLAIVFSVNAGKVINTRREVVEAVSLMLFKSLILCVHPEASWN